MPSTPIEMPSSHVLPSADQAEELRRMVGNMAGPTPALVPDGPPMIVVAGGRPGVGATTVALNLAAVLADRQQRVLAVDATEHGGNLMELANGPRGALPCSLSEVVAGKSTLAEALVPGPSGTLLLAMRRGGASSPTVEPRRGGFARSSTGFSRGAQHRLLAALQSLDREVDLVVADVGSGLSPWTRRFWLRARLVLLVTTADANSLLDTYSTIKLSSADALGPEVRLLVNRCDDDREAANIQQRLASACQQFLGRTVPALPALPRHRPPRGSSSSKPCVWREPTTSFGQAALWMGRSVSDVLRRTAAA